MFYAHVLRAERESPLGTRTYCIDDLYRIWSTSCLLALDGSTSIQLDCGIVAKFERKDQDKVENRYNAREFLQTTPTFASVYYHAH